MTSKVIYLLIDCKTFNHLLEVELLGNAFRTPANTCDETFS